MVRDERERDEDERAEGDIAPDVPTDEEPTQEEHSVTGEAAHEGQTAAPGEPSADLTGAGGIPPDEDQGDTSITAAPASSTADPTPSAVNPPTEAPPESLPPATVAGGSVIASRPEMPGISFGQSPSEFFSSDAGGDIPELEGISPESPASDLGQPVFFDSDATPSSPTIPPPETNDEPLRSPLAPRPVRQKPFVVEVSGREQREKKRLEIEVVVTIANQERIAQVASSKTLETFARLAESLVYKVAQDLRTFRESYRAVWGRRF